jgi:hypothetical protein
MDTVIMINFLALELNSHCNLENRGFKLQDLIVWSKFLHTHKQKEKQMQNEKSPTEL